MPFEEEMEVPGPYTRTSGFLRTRDALRDGLDFTAVFVGTDMVAIGAIAALLDAGLHVPDDVSIVGFDDVPFAGDLTPALTTVRCSGPRSPDRPARTKACGGRTGRNGRTSLAGRCMRTAHEPAGSGTRPGNPRTESFTSGPTLGRAAKHV
ncbi:substrate-binding domain-containing protein [Streptomyces sp. NPDC002701]|uniref:substrate-binding domain-containing protein n=1 Tax=Streptomyces sp. NPDC002701 TaxID=3364661 RepID=UPI003675DFD2